VHVRTGQNRSDINIRLHVMPPLVHMVCSASAHCCHFNLLWHDDNSMCSNHSHHVFWSAVCTDCVIVQHVMFIWILPQTKTQQLSVKAAWFASSMLDHSAQTHLGCWSSASVLGICDIWKHMLSFLGSGLIKKTHFYKMAVLTWHSANTVLFLCCCQCLNKPSWHHISTLCTTVSS